MHGFGLDEKKINNKTMGKMNKKINEEYKKKSR